MIDKDLCKKVRDYEFEENIRRFDSNMNEFWSHHESFRNKDLKRIDETEDVDLNALLNEIIN